MKAGGGRCGHCTSDSSPMSILSASRFLERSLGCSAAWRANQDFPSPVRFGFPGVSLPLFLILSLSLSVQSQTLSLADLDNHIFNAAISSLVGLNVSLINTGQIYNATVPSNITALSVQAIQFVRLRSGSLTRHGIIFNEIKLPIGVTIVEPVSTHVVLVYRKFSSYSYFNVSSSPNGTVLVSDVVGIAAYDYKDIATYQNAVGATLTVVSNATAPIVYQQQASRSLPLSELSCVRFNNTANGSSLVGTVQNITTSGGCTWNILGDFSLLGPPIHSKSDTWEIVLGSVLGGVGFVLFLILAACLILVGLRSYRRSHIASMEKKADQQESLGETRVGSSRAPSAGTTRTKPTLES